MNRVLSIEAKEKGICRAWGRMLRKAEASGDVETLLRLYTEGITWCLKHNYPEDKEVFTQYREMCEREGVIVDTQFSFTNKPSLIVLGASGGTAKYDKFAVGRVRIANECEVRVEASGYSRVIIDVWNKAKLHIVATDKAQVVVLYKSGTITKEQDGDSVITVRHRKE